MVVSHSSQTAPAKNEKKFISYIHNFRGVAILFVVACHLLLDWAEGSDTYKILELLFGNGTVLFVFIAGYLFQHLTRKLHYADYLKKKLTNVIIPYLIVSAPIIIFRIITNDVPGYILTPHPDFISWTIIEKISYFILRGAHMQPLWFVPMIALFYLAAPVFNYIDRHPKLYYSLLVFIAISILVDREPFSDIPRMFLHFISVYMLGMFMSRYKEQYLNFAAKYIMLINLLLIIALISNYVFYDSIRNPANYIQKMLFCAFFIYWLWRFERFVPSFINVLAELSFGIFFLHYYSILVIKAIYEKVFGTEVPGNFLYWIVDYVLVLVTTVLVIKSVKRLFPKYSRYLIGC
jgi:surface polysaccharide O-acyltransferase-like enzyme